MFATNSEASDTTQLHVFRKIGTRESVTSSCKKVLATAGFSQFTSYGVNFVCTRQMGVTGGTVTLSVKVELLSAELCEVTFERVQSSMNSVHSQMVYNKINRIQAALELVA